MDTSPVLNIVAAVVVAFLGKLSVSMFDGYFKDRKRLIGDLVLQYGLAFVLTVASVGLVLRSGVIQTSFASIASGDDRGRWFATGLLLNLGMVLHMIREYWRRLYAVLELAVATVTAYSSLHSISNWHLLASWVPIAGAVYLVVRGLDNLAQGIEAARQAQERLTKG